MRIVTVALSFSLLSSLVPATAVADTSQRLTPPKTNLGPSGNAPIFLGVHGQVGKAFDFETEQIGYGAELVFRPGSAADFLSFLYNWNAGMCWQIDYQKISETMSIFSGDCLVRKYVEDMRDEYVSTSAFFGMGFGASRVSFPVGTAGSNTK